MRHVAILFAARSCALLLLAAGCGEGDDTARRISRSHGSAGAGGAAMPGVTASSPAGVGEPAFGNSDGPSQAPLSEIEGAGECEVGVFCENAEPDPDECGSLTLEGDVETVEKPGNVLLVFDRSGSMMEDWNGQPRWQVAGTAIENALAPIADQMTVGSVFFPSPDAPAEADSDPAWGLGALGAGDDGFGACGVSEIGADDQVAFAPGGAFLDQMGGADASPKYAPVRGGFTPLSEALAVAQVALQDATLEGEISVVIITDGDPNCEWDQALATEIVADWQAQGIDTHVVGLPGLGGMGELVLNQLAMTGGTGTYLTPSDSAALEAALDRIVIETISVGFDSCFINLSPPAEVPEKLHLVVTQRGTESDVPHEYDTGEAAWTVSDDGAAVELLGNTCAAATSGAYESIRFEFGCVELPPASPPPPVE